MTSNRDKLQIEINRFFHQMNVRWISYGVILGIVAVKSDLKYVVAWGFFGLTYLILCVSEWVSREYILFKQNNGKKTGEFEESSDTN